MSTLLPPRLLYVSIYSSPTPLITLCVYFFRFEPFIKNSGSATMGFNFMITFVLCAQVT